MKQNSTSWEKASGWYEDLVGKEGHYFHKEIILPGLQRLAAFPEKSVKVLDLACGPGILTSILPETAIYTGIDASSGLLNFARRQRPKAQCFFKEADLSLPLSLDTADYDYAYIILALQNMAKPRVILNSAFSALKPGGKLFIVINHPCFRIPRQSHWGVDEKTKIQYRRVDTYMSELNIPIRVHPSRGIDSQELASFHHPLSAYCRFLKESGFVIETMEEWTSNKKSQGGMARAENRARAEIPLFLAIAARKETL